MPALRALPRLLVVLGLVLSTQSLLMLQMAFEVRQDYIAEHFCINRDRPEMECDGKCYLKARMEGHTHDELAEGHDHASMPPHTHPAPPSDHETNLLQVALSVTWLVPPRASLGTPPVGERSYANRPSDRFLPGTVAEVFHPPRAA